MRFSLNPCFFTYRCIGLAIFIYCFQVKNLAIAEESGPNIAVPATTSEFYSEAAYRVHDRVSGGDGYARARWPAEWLLAPLLGVGFDTMSLVDAPGKTDRNATDAYATLGLDLRFKDLRLFVERRYPTRPHPLESRATAVYATFFQDSVRHLIFESYLEAVAWRRGAERQERDELADGYVRGGYRVLSAALSGAFVDLLIEPFAAASASKWPGDNRLELRAGPRLGWGAALGAHGYWGANFAAQEVLGRYTGAGDRYVTQRYLVTVGGSQ